MAFVTEEHIQQFKADGFFVLEKVIPNHQLKALQDECSLFMLQADQRYYENLNHKDHKAHDHGLLKACEDVAHLKTPFRLQDVQHFRPSTTEDELNNLHPLIRLPRGLYELDNPIGITHPGKSYPFYITRKDKSRRMSIFDFERYFISHKFLESENLQKFLFGPIAQSICHSVMGEAYLFLEQFVVKGPQVGMKFGWHQDSGYIPYAHDPYITFWCALDDMSEANGTIYAIPFSTHQSCRSFLPHNKESGSNDMVCFGGEVGVEQGVPMNIPAGSIVVFSSQTPHCSGANTTDKMRRAYIAQFSHHPINAPELGAPRHFAEKV